MHANCNLCLGHPTEVISGEKRFESRNPHSFTASLVSPGEDSESEDKFEHLKKVFLTFNMKREQGEFCDFTITVGRKNFPVHKLVLSSQSSYFDEMFRSVSEESSQSSIELRNASELAIGSILDFMYGQPIALDCHNIEEVVKYAHQWVIKQLLDSSKEYLTDHWIDLNPMTAAMLCYKLDMEPIAKTIINAMNFYISYSQKQFADVSDDFIRAVKTDPRIVTRKGMETVQYDSLLSLLSWLHVDVHERLDKALDLLPLYEVDLMPTDRMVRNISAILGSHPHARDHFLERFLLQESEFHHKVLTLGLELTGIRSVLNKLYIYEFDFHDWAWISTEVEDVNFKVEKAVLKKDSLYLFGITECCSVNLTSTIVTWLPDLPEKRIKSSFCLSDHSIFMVGGSKFDDEPFSNSIFKLDFSNSQIWSEQAALPVIRLNPSLLFHENQVFIVGGDEEEISDKPVPNSNRIFVYNHTANMVDPLGYTYFSTPYAKLVITESSLLILPYVIACTSKYQMQMLDLNSGRVDVFDSDLIFRTLRGIFDICPRKDDFVLACLYNHRNATQQDYILLSSFITETSYPFSNKCKPFALLPLFTYPNFDLSNKFLFVRRGK